MSQSAAVLRPWTHYRAVVAQLSRDRRPDDPELHAARRDLQEARRAAKIDAHVAEIVAAAPELTASQLGRLAVLLGGVSDGT